jgi:crotonobetaine/carnitine-CoA ligase
VDPDPRDEDLHALIRRQAEHHGERTFMSFVDGSSMSFRAFERRVAGLRGHLRDLGVAPGDRVALMLKNSLFYPVAWLGTVTAGAVAVPINSRLGEVDARYVLDHSGAVAMLTDDSVDDVARAAGGAHRSYFVARAGDAMQEMEDAEPAPAPATTPGATSNIQYTSGTTGFPKGCQLSHRYWQRIGAAAVDLFALEEGDVMLTAQAHSYMDPQWIVTAALRSGCHLVLVDGFHPTTFMRDVAEWGVTVFYCLGVMPTLLLKQPPGPWDDNAVQRVFCSAIPLAQHRAIEERWGAPWYEVFGMTESGMNIAVSPEDHDTALGTGCLGRALAHNEATVVDSDDRELAPGEVGELVVRGLGFMDAYYRDPAATAEVFRNGWLHTGDLATRDADGLIYYKGRRKEMIRRAGENIAPVEIETVLSCHDAVLECAVAPVPDPDLGEEAKAYVVLRPGVKVTVEELHAFLRERLAAFKVPRYWEMRQSLPHTASEKVAKHELEAGRATFLEETADLRPRASEAPRPAKQPG